MKKKLFLSAVALVCIAAMLVPLVGYLWGVGPCTALYDKNLARLPGNDTQYALDNTEPVREDYLHGKKIIFLGSSVTYGAASLGVSFADYIGKRNDCTIIKEAVSGTTLVEQGNSYIKRLRTIEEAEADLFICQLSTNDATLKKPLGKIASGYDLEEFDTGTVAGAIEYIIAYAREQWGCPVVFYTNCYYDSETYGKMVALLQFIKEKWDITVIDMYSDEDFNDITDEERALYMKDKIHPTQAGYREWWTPYMESRLYEMVLVNS